MAATTDGQNPFGIGEIVTARARKVIREYVSLVSSEIFPVASLSEVLQRLELLGDDYSIPALVEATGCGTPRERLIAAFMTWGISRKAPGRIPSKAISQCREIFIKALSGDDDKLRLFACLLLSQSALPDEVIPILQKLIHSSSRLESVTAAAALSQSDSDLVIAVQVLHHALLDQDEVLSSVAGVALLRVGVGQEDAVRKISKHLLGLNPGTQYSILVAAKPLGIQAKGIFDAVAKILDDSKRPPEIRQVAAAALGCITTGSARATPMLMQALRSPDWEVVKGAVDGLEASGHFPDEAAGELANLLAHKDESIRVAAASGLAVMKERAAPALPMMLKRLSEETNLDIVGLLIPALSAIGSAAIPSLVAIIVEGDRLRAEPAMQALAGMGSNAARTLAELLRQTEDERVRKMVVAVLVGMGRRAVPAIPVLADILDETDNDELAIHCTMSLCLCGPSAVAAIPALIRCITQRGCDDNAVGMWAERALWTMREHAIPALEGAIKANSNSQRKFLERALAGMGASFGSDLGRLEQFDCDDLLASFVDVGTILETKGETSFRDLAIILKDKEVKGALTPGYEGVSQSGIRKHLAALENKIGGPRLTTHGDNKKGDLTPGGRALLAEAREYLRKKSLQRKRYSA